ncbi:MAG: hypothetical protein J0H29_21035 [Sphingobacteriales bacterium]|nr:hypothetical protein [Sphingobacteriales bacterium]OJY86368.1 MAG: hypothetical protein BGP14_20550 [Sphingobacteriales bacterium 44-15]
MKYTSFTVKRNKKNPGSYKVEFTGSRIDSMGTWESSGTFGELILVNGYLILMKFIAKPVAVYNDLDHFCRVIKNEFGIAPRIE